jgi:DNA mismatch repair ATPase MutS
VANSIATDRSLLITGSNMSGKSTFLRTVGVNALLAQTLGTALAAAYRAPRFTIMTSIGRSDSLLEGKSYYLAEVERVRALITRGQSAERCLFIIDELFRGTNTTERIAASFAVLEKIDRVDGRPRHVTLVATHDLELSTLLAPLYLSHHFREIIESGELRFDYQLKPGVSSTRNAIALLELMGFPADVVARAREVAATTAG